MKKILTLLIVAFSFLGVSAPTNAPSLSQVTVMVNPSNSVIISPTNIFTANSNTLNQAVNTNTVYQGSTNAAKVYTDSSTVLATNAAYVYANSITNSIVASATNGAKAYSDSLTNASVSDSRLSTNVELLSITQTNSGAKVFTGAVSGSGITNAVQAILVPGGNVTFTTNANGKVTISSSGGGGGGGFDHTGALFYDSNVLFFNITNLLTAPFNPDSDGVVQPLGLNYYGVVMDTNTGTAMYIDHSNGEWGIIQGTGLSGDGYSCALKLNRSAGTVASDYTFSGSFQGSWFATPGSHTAVNYGVDTNDAVNLQQLNDTIGALAVGAGGTNILYVSKSGSDSNNGYSAPFLTLNAAHTAWTSGKSICVLDGVYNEADIVLNDGEYWHFNNGAGILYTNNSTNIFSLTNGGAASISGYGFFERNSTNCINSQVFYNDFNSTLRVQGRYCYNTNITQAPFGPGGGVQMSAIRAWSSGVDNKKSSFRFSGEIRAWWGAIMWASNDCEVIADRILGENAGNYNALWSPTNATGNWWITANEIHRAQLDGTANSRTWINTKLGRGQWNITSGKVYASIQKLDYDHADSGSTLTLGGSAEAWVDVQKPSESSGNWLLINGSANAHVHFQNVESTFGTNAQGIMISQLSANGSAYIVGDTINGGGGVQVINSTNVTLHIANIDTRSNNAANPLVLTNVANLNIGGCNLIAQGTNYAIQGSSVVNWSSGLMTTNPIDPGITFGGMSPIFTIYNGRTNITATGTSLTINIGHTMPNTNYTPVVSLLGAALATAIQPTYGTFTTTSFSVNFPTGGVGASDTNLLWSVIYSP